MPLLQRISLGLLFITLITACSSLPKEITHKSELPTAQPNSTLSTLIASNAPEKIQSDMSAVILQSSGWDALAQRLALIESAEHSIDVQYYIWNSDSSGSYLASRLLAAADRGVKVRVLLDDMNINQRESSLTALNLHPEIEIRIFNPTPNRRGLTKWLDFAGDFSRLNRRMHNKSFTVDGVLSVVGGRNIGDEYFDLSNEINFKDRDVLVTGKVVPEIQASFARYWNSEWAYPVNLLTDETPTKIPNLNEIKIPRYTNYPALPKDKETSKALLTGLMSKFHWVNAYFTSDVPIPNEVSNTNLPKATAQLLAKLAKQSKHEVLIESAYLVLDDHQLDALNKLSAKGVKIKAVTNSMASNDLLSNHSGYAERRTEMLENGMQLFELKPSTALCLKSTKDTLKCAPNLPYGLHAKSFVFDSEITAIGSFNFNLRSTYLNTESLLIIEDKEISESLAKEIDKTMREDNSWRLDLEEGEIRWHSGSKNWNSDPETGQWDRIKSYFLQLLPIEKYT